LLVLFALVLFALVLFALVLFALVLFAPGVGRPKLWGAKLGGLEERTSVQRRTTVRPSRGPSVAGAVSPTIVVHVA
jgi:hypothetical protein